MRPERRYRPPRTWYNVSQAWVFPFIFILIWFLWSIQSDRQTSHFTERPKSCYSSLPGSAYSVTTNTYQTTTTTNYPSDTNQYPKTATYASSTQTTSIPPVVKPLPQYNTPALDAAAPGGTLNTHPFPGASTTSFGKLSDSKSVPRRDIFVASNFAPGCAKCNQRIQGVCCWYLSKKSNIVFARIVWMHWIVNGIQTVSFAFPAKNHSETVRSIWKMAIRTARRIGITCSPPSVLAALIPSQPVIVGLRH